MALRCTMWAGGQGGRLAEPAIADGQPWLWHWEVGDMLWLPNTQCSCLTFVQASDSLIIAGQLLQLLPAEQQAVIALDL